MAKFLNKYKLIETLKHYRTKSQEDKDARVVVGYAMPYAMPVHENTEANHPNGGNAKFLEGPARRLRTTIASIITQTYIKTKNLAQAMFAGGEFLQVASQGECPVKHGSLRASAYTAFAKNEAKARAEGLKRGLAIYTPQASRPKRVRMRLKPARSSRKKR